MLKAVIRYFRPSWVSPIYIYEKLATRQSEGRSRSKAFRAASRADDEVEIRVERQAWRVKGELARSNIYRRTWISSRTFGFITMAVFIRFLMSVFIYFYHLKSRSGYSLSEWLWSNIGSSEPYRFTSWIQDRSPKLHTFVRCGLNQGTSKMNCYVIEGAVQSHPFLLF